MKIMPQVKFRLKIFIMNNIYKKNVFFLQPVKTSLLLLILKNKKGIRLQLKTQKEKCFYLAYSSRLFFALYI